MIIIVFVDYSFELKDSEPLLGRLWGFVGRYHIVQIYLTIKP